MSFEELAKFGQEIDAAMDAGDVAALGNLCTSSLFAA
jgi:hypothetical protein